MKKYFNTASVFLAAFILLTQSSCVKDECKREYSYTWFKPLYTTAAAVRANIRSNAPQAIEYPGKICLAGNYIFLNEVNKGIHIIDNSNPAAPVNKAFIDLPGNVDIAVKGNYLYADFYTDLVTLDISNPMQVQVTKFLENVFPHRYYYGFNADTSMIIYAWEKATTSYTYDCETSFGGPIAFEGMLFNAADAGLGGGAAAAGSPVGISGSLARFSIINDYLYSLSADSLNVTSISSLAAPQRAGAVQLGWGMETLYPFKDKLFIGSNAGMFVYSVKNPVIPAKLGSFEHVRSCDPVIADDTHAYVTLHSGSFCQGFTNQLEVLDISNILAPQMVRTYELSNPRGLSKDGNLLFICDGPTGLKIFDAANPAALVLKKQIPLDEANDVIAYHNIALAVGKAGIFQYDYSNPSDIRLLSKITVNHD